MFGSTRSFQQVDALGVNAIGATIDVVGSATEGRRDGSVSCSQAR